MVADLYGALNERKSPVDGTSTPKFTRLDELTMFADYRVPQTLRLVGIFEYSPALTEAIDVREEELPYSSPYEVEIRACTVVAVEMIMKAIRDSGVNCKIEYAF